MADLIGSNQSSESVFAESRICRVCGNSALTLAGCIQSQRTDEKVAAYICSNCRHFSLFPILYTKRKKFEWDGVEYYLERKTIHISFFNKRLDQLQSISQKMFGQKPHYFLDVGCAIGLSVALASARGMKAMGIEPEQKLAEYGVNHLGVSIEQRFFDQTFTSIEKFDLIFCEQVLEHIDEPYLLLSLMKKHLSAQGIIYIGIPPVFPINTFISFLKQKFSPKLRIGPMLDIFYDPDEHISCFTSQSIHCLANRVGLKIRPVSSLVVDFSPKALLKKIIMAGGNSGGFVLFR